MTISVIRARTRPFSEGYRDDNCSGCLPRLVAWQFLYVFTGAFNSNALPTTSIDHIHRRPFSPNDTDRTKLHHTPSASIDNLAIASSKMNEMDRDIMEAVSGIITPGYGSEDDDATAKDAVTKKIITGTALRSIGDQNGMESGANKSGEDEIDEESDLGESDSEKIDAGVFHESESDYKNIDDDAVSVSNTEVQNKEDNFADRKSVV